MITTILITVIITAIVIAPISIAVYRNNEESGDKLFDKLDAMELDEKANQKLKELKELIK